MNTRLYSADTLNYLIEEVKKLQHVFVQLLHLHMYEIRPINYIRLTISHNL